MQILNRYFNQFKARSAPQLQAPAEAPIQSLQGPTPRRLPSTPPLVGVFTTNSHTDKLRIH